MALRKHGQKPVGEVILREPISVVRNTWSHEDLSPSQPRQRHRQDRTRCIPTSVHIPTTSSRICHGPI